jgi:MarR-like DNA-binding transcriptional regulator SgrR of sgrS sRNA
VSLGGNALVRPIRLALCLALAATLRPADAEAALRPAYGGTVRMAVFEPLSLDPATLSLPTDGEISGLVFEPLVGLDSAGALVPGLAESWQPGDDGLSFTLQLAPVRFSDGTPLTPQDVLASLARLRGTRQGWIVSNLLLGPESVALSPNQLQLRLKAPDPLALYKLAHPAAAISRPGPDGRPVGTAPFAIASISADRRRAVLSPNPYHPDGPPYLESVELVNFDAAEAALRELERGQIDLAPVPLDQADRLAGGTPELRLYTLENFETIVLLLHPKRFGPQHKSWIRSHLDLSSMISFRLRGHGGRAKSFDAHLTPYAEEPTSEPGPDAAPPGLSKPMRLLFPAHLTLAHQLAARIRGDLQGHGAAVEVEPVAPAVLEERLGRGDYEMALVFVHSLGAPPLTVLDWAQTLGLEAPAMSGQLASWLVADESFQKLPSILPLFQTRVHMGAQARLVDLKWTASGRPTLEQTWWRPRLDIPGK